LENYEKQKTCDLLDCTSRGYIVRQSETRSNGYPNATFAHMELSKNSDCYRQQVTPMDT